MTDLSPEEFSRLLRLHFGVSYALEEHQGQLRASRRMVVPEERRGQGVFTSIIPFLKAYADSRGQALVITNIPERMEYQTRLGMFYARNGFSSGGVDPRTGAPMFVYHPQPLPRP